MMHDGRIFQNSNICARFKQNKIDGIAIGYNGYPLRSYLITPLLNVNKREERRFNDALCNAKVKIENVFGVLKRRFPCLRQQLRLKLRTALAVIIACAVLYNIARKMSLPLPDNSDGENEIIPVQVYGNANQVGQARRNNQTLQISKTGNSFNFLKFFRVMYFHISLLGKSYTCQIISD